MSTMQRDYTGQIKEHSDEEIRAGKELSHGRWLGKQAAKAAIAEYNRTWKNDSWHEIMTCQSARKLASELAERQTERAEAPLNAI